MNTAVDFGQYFLRQWLAMMPGMLIRGILVAALFEGLIYVGRRLLQARMHPVLMRDAGEPPALRVQRRRLLLAVPTLLLRGVLYVVAILILLRIFRMDNWAELLPLGLAAVVVALVAFTRPLRDAAHGYLLLWDHLYRVGERIQVGELRGIVEEIRLRWTLLEAEDGRRVVLPHSRLGAVVNLSRSKHLLEPGADVPLPGPPLPAEGQEQEPAGSDPAPGDSPDSETS
jgi:small-conductance mechanosensitive channel